VRGLLDTSVFIAAENGRQLDGDRIPEENAISVVTLAELQAGVLAAPDLDVRARRMATLSAVGDIEVVDVDEGAALMWAHMRVHLARSGRRCNVNDLWIAASAASRRLAVVTQDDDFAAVEGVAGLQVVRV
jgi:predicted nucleic acid-binding protein